MPVRGRVGSLESTGTDHSECVERESIRGELQWVGNHWDKAPEAENPVTFNYLFNDVLFFANQNSISATTSKHHFVQIKER